MRQARTIGVAPAVDCLREDDECTTRPGFPHLPWCGWLGRSATLEEPARSLSPHGRQKTAWPVAAGPHTVKGQAPAGVPALTSGGRIMKTSTGSSASTTNP